MNKKFNIKRISIHFLFWTAVLLVFTFIYGRTQENYLPTFIHALLTLPIYIGATYYTLYVLIPKYFFTKQYKKVILPVIYMLLFTAFFEVMLTILFAILSLEFFPGDNDTLINKFALDIYFRLIGIYIVVFSAAAVKLLKHWYSVQQKNSELVKQKLEAELKFLRAQVHPHFLYNTLNNLYSLALDKSDKTADMILQLSGMLDYILYECKEDFVPLDKELRLIDNYIELEKVRYNEKLSIEKKYDIEKTDVKISPLIILPFIENSFKHGVSSQIENAWIKLNLLATATVLELNISNSKKENSDSNSETKKNGIGLKNVRSRLDLIYEGNYKLEIKDSSNEFEISLKINLTQKDVT